MPQIVNVSLPGVSAKDIILEILEAYFGCNGGTEMILEYSGSRAR